MNHYTHAGVGIVINNELANYIREIEPINDRIMSITLGYTVPITIICNYSRTATEGHTFEQKTEHYGKLEEITKKHLNKGPTYTCGDFNARLVRKHDNGEPIGNFIFDKGQEAPMEKAQQEKVRETGKYS